MSAIHNAPSLNVELIPPTIPTFDIFRHKLVPSGELLSKEEKDAVVEKYHAKPYQFPWMESKDPMRARSFTQGDSAIKRSLYVPKRALDRRDSFVVICDVVRTGNTVRTLVDLILGQGGN